MTDLGSLAVWGVLMGVIVGVVTHVNVPSTIRQSLLKGYLGYGAAAVAYYFGAFLLGFDLKHIAIFGVGLVGFPVFVAGLFLSVMGLSAVSGRETPDD